MEIEVIFLLCCLAAQQLFLAILESDGLYEIHLNLSNEVASSGVTETLPFSTEHIPKGNLK